MSKYKYRLVEQDEPQGGGEETPVSSKEKIIYDLVLTPQIVSTDEVVKAFETVDNYGPYVSNLRNTKADVEKAVVDYFGPNQPFAKKKLEKERGLKGWFDRNQGKGWVDCKASKKGNLVPCGRKKTGKGAEREYPACRPTLSACNKKGKKRKKSSKRISWE